MQRTIPSESNPLGLPLFSSSLSLYNLTVHNGVVYRWFLDFPWYRAYLKGHQIAEGNQPVKLVLDVVEHLVALDNLKGSHVCDQWKIIALSAQLR